MDADAQQQPMPEGFPEILQAAVQYGASDIHIKADAPVIFRIGGELTTLDAPAPTRAWIDELVERITPAYLLARLREEHEVDFSFEHAGTGRFRANVFQQRGLFVCALRLVKAEIKTLDALNLPAVAARLCEMPQGLILVAGSTGSGKSTTLAAMIA